MANSRLFCPMVRVHNHHLRKENKAPFFGFFVTSSSACDTLPNRCPVSIRIDAHKNYQQGMKEQEIVRYVLHCILITMDP